VAETKSVSPSRVIRFGVFQVNLAARELSKHGVRVRLPGQPFCILSILLEKPGEVITREEMCQRLWASDTFVDFEHSLNSAIKKLRAALNDTPENSRYIETIPRVGYRFIAPVEPLPVGPDALPAADASVLQPQGANPAASKRNRTILILAAVAICTLVLSLGIALSFFPARMPRVTSTTRLTHSGRIDDWANPVTDGVRIYYLERDGGHWNLMQTSVQGGGSQHFAASFPGYNARILDVSRDLSQFLVGTFVMRDTEMLLWTLPVQGGAPHRMGNIQGRSAVWTPDGKGILYSSEKDLLLADASGGNTRKFLTASGRASSMVYSPDGRMIRFSTLNPATNLAELWEVSAEGNGLHRLFFNWKDLTSQCCGRWTPDGRYFVFLAWQRDRLGVWAVRENRSRFPWKSDPPFNLISGPTTFLDVLPSVDGRRIFALGQNPENDVMQYEQEHHALVAIPGVPHSGAVLYCPTSQWILYRNDADLTLWRSKADGTQPLQLTRPPLITADPQWSPDASQIVFSGYDQQANQGSRVYIVPRDGGEPRVVLPEDSWQGHPKWLPDGKSVAVSLGPRDGGDPSRAGIYVADVVTHRSYKLPGSGDINSAQWSPDGRWVAGTTNDYHHIELYDVAKNSWTELVSGTLFGGPMWSSDSQSLYYQDLLEEDEPIYRFRISTKRREKIYDFHKELSSGYFRCAFYDLKSDGSLLVYLSRSSSDLYSFDVDFP
jgi:Tol biopolymer transport system component/DNA-binding winged helix-turn-helix (wHTH) protein